MKNPQKPYIKVALYLSVSQYKEVHENDAQNAQIGKSARDTFRKAQEKPSNVKKKVSRRKNDQLVSHKVKI